MTLLSHINDGISDYKKKEQWLRYASENDPTNTVNERNLDDFRREWRTQLVSLLSDPDVQSVIDQPRKDLRKARLEEINNKKEEQARKEQARKEQMTPEERAMEKLQLWRSSLENHQTPEQKLMSLLNPTPEQKLMSLLNPTPAIPWHTLDMEVQGRKIYGLLPILQVKLSKRLSEVRTDIFVGRENEFDEKLEWYLTSIDTIKMHMPQSLASEKDKDTKDKTIIRGSEPWNSNTTWVDGIVLCRNEGYNWWSEKQMKNFENKVDAIIDDMMSDFRLSECEVVEMIFLRKWWGLYGW